MIMLLLLLLPYIASARCSQLQMSRQESKELERSKKKIFPQCNAWKSEFGTNSVTCSGYIDMSSI